MSTELFRNYLDIINENSQESILNEGMIDSMVTKASSLINKVSPDTLQKVTALVSNALGKPADSLSLKDVTLTNIKKVIAANKQLAEDEIEFTDVPGSLAANQNKNAKIYGILGALLGGFQGAFMQDHTFINAGLPVIVGAAMLAIIFAVIARASSSADRVATVKKRERIPYTTPGAEPGQLFGKTGPGKIS